MSRVPSWPPRIGADRFLREIKVAAHLQHPNILALYDSGEAAGFLYYVMPFVEGESLARPARPGAAALPAGGHPAHLRGRRRAALRPHHARIVHRDIKPENILLQDGHALVADFGIARAVSQAGGDKLTETGMAVGTPHYMSPEQAIGGDHVDGRSDQYSLACVPTRCWWGSRRSRAPTPWRSWPGIPWKRCPVSRWSATPFRTKSKTRSCGRWRRLRPTGSRRFRDFADALAQADLGPSARRTSSRAMQAVRRHTPRGVAASKGLGGRGVRFWAACARRTRGSGRYRVGRLATLRTDRTVPPPRVSAGSTPTGSQSSTFEATTKGIRSATWRTASPKG